MPNDPQPKTPDNILEPSPVPGPQISDPREFGPGQRPDLKKFYYPMKKLADFYPPKKGA
jgi:hypothetical protein